MNSNDEKYQLLLDSLINRANAISEIEPPEELLKIIQASRITTPFTFEEEILHQAFDSLHSKYNFIGDAKHSIVDFTQEQKNQTENLIAWLINGLKNWQKNDDLNFKNLASLFIVSCFLDKNNCIWRILSLYVDGNIELFKQLKELLSLYKTEFNARRNGKVTIWEQESVEEFKNAMLNGDWLAIHRLWGQRFETSSQPNFFLSQMTQLLAYFDLSMLYDAFQNTKDIPNLMTSIYGLTNKQVLLLGAGSNNPYVELCTVHHVTQNRTLYFDNDENNCLVSIFKKVSKDISRFKTWMKIFNIYPSLQEALGLFLANSNNEEILEVYINAINLSTSNNENRKSTAKCFEIFKNNADIETRKILWQKAFDRWHQWNFFDPHLFKVAFSELDFALTGYFLECLTQDERSQYQDEIVNKMSAITTQWYESKSDFITQWYRLLSQFQPVTYANYATNDLWLMEGLYYTPEEFSNNPYFDMLIG